MVSQLLELLTGLAIYGTAAVAVVLLVQAIVRISRAVDRISKSLDEIAIAMRSGPRP
jgi:hypothetical protein